ncbi:lycopene cyclase domain-containing protein [Halorussus marinus]|uniref:lycopene cyclase domain-containing protein n=1 Tax=Halorussus marinus TaxID=2505976 RepID=UPI00106ECCFE|nr:lycopene cyclase domain-containing protein [Halorussus marinus]
MTSPVTYLDFLIAALGPPALALGAVVFARRERPSRAAAGIGALVCIAVSYTAPWDSYLIGRGVWRYGDGVVAARFARVPLGEWLFFAGQTGLTGLWYYALAPRIDPALPASPDARTVGAAVWAALAVVGAALAVASDGTYYLGMTLVWAAPVAAFLWAVGGPVLWSARRLVAVAVAVPSAYLWAADRFAIGRGLWTISADHSTGLAVLGLPIEEAVFFVLTNLLVVQGLVLFDWTLARAADRGAGHAVEGLVPGTMRVSRRWR